MVLQELINNFSTENLKNFFFRKIPAFKDYEEDYSFCFEEKSEISDNYEDILKIGEAQLNDTEDLLVISVKSLKTITSRTGKKRQFDIAKTILKQENKDAAIFVFYDTDGNFRFSLIRMNYSGSIRDYTATTARKATGSFYTPRKIVNYMTEKSLKEYFKSHLKNIPEIDAKLDKLIIA